MAATDTADLRIKERLAQMGVSTADFARAAGIYLPYAYDVINGRDRVGPVRRARIDAALVELERKCAADQ